MQIPLPKGLRGEENAPKQREILRNCYFDPSEMPTINTRPAVRLAGLAKGRCRGIGMFKDELFMVSNDRLVKITLTYPDNEPTNNLTVTDLGQIQGDQLCQLEAGFTALVIMVVGGKCYTYDDVNGLREITDPLYVASVSVTYDSGRWAFIPASGDPFFWTELNDPTNILPTSFADAEEFPDKNKAVKAKKKQIYVSGTRSIERLQYNPTLDTYQVIGGATSSVGYVGGMCDYAETFMFIGQGGNGGFSIYAMAQDAQPVSNKTVDEILNSYNYADLEGALGNSFRLEGAEFAVFQLPNHTLVFSGDWSLWNSGTQDETPTPWTVGFFQFCYGYIFTGDLTNRNIGIITNDHEEYGQPIDGEIQTFVRTEPRSNGMIRRIFLQANSGFQDDPQTIGLQISRDGKVFGPLIYRTFGAFGDYSREISWGSPVIKMSDCAIIRLRWSGKIRLSCDGMSFE